MILIINNTIDKLIKTKSFCDGFNIECANNCHEQKCNPRGRLCLTYYNIYDQSIAFQECIDRAQLKLKVKLYLMSLLVISGFDFLRNTIKYSMCNGGDYIKQQNTQFAIDGWASKLCS